MTSLSEVLGTYAPDISESEFLNALQSRLAAVHRAGGQALTAGERGFLAEHGGPESAEILTSWDADVQVRRRSEVAAVSVQHVLVNTVSPAEAVRLAGKGRPQISRDLTHGRLYGIRVGTHWRIPRWQFADGQALPGLAAVVPTIPDQMHPSVVEGLMTTPQDELDGRTPFEHLRTGGDPAIVAELVSGLDH